MLKVYEVKAEGTGQTWGTILAFVWKPQKTSSPQMKPGVTLSASSVSHMWYKSRRKCTKCPKKAVIYNYFDSIHTKELYL